MSRFVPLVPVAPGGAASFLSGSGAPAAALGNSGDTYLDLTGGVGKFWKKSGTGWVDTGTTLESAIGVLSIGSWFASLPVTAPAAVPGTPQPWNDGGTLAFS